MNELDVNRFIGSSFYVIRPVSSQHRPWGTKETSIKSIVGASTRRIATMVQRLPSLPGRAPAEATYAAPAEVSGDAPVPGGPEPEAGAAGLETSSGGADGAPGAGPGSSSAALASAGVAPAAGGPAAGGPPKKPKLLLDRTFWQVYGWPGVALVVSFALGTGILFWLVVNGFRVYAYSKDLDVDDKIVRTRLSAGYDYSAPVAASETEAIIYSGFDDDIYGSRSGVEHPCLSRCQWLTWLAPRRRPSTRGGAEVGGPSGPKQ